MDIEGVDLYARFADESDPVWFGQMWSSGIATREEQHGVKTDIVNPEVGVPYATEQIAIIKGTKKLDEAKRFVDWFGGAEIQGEWAEQFSTMPANEKAMDKTSETNLYISENFKPQDIDWNFVAEHIDEWMEKIELEYMK